MPITIYWNELFTLLGCSSFISIAMIKCSDKEQLRGGRAYFSSPFHNTVHDRREVKVGNGNLKQLSYHIHSQSREKPVRMCSVAWLYAARFFHSSSVPPCWGNGDTHDGLELATSINFTKRICHRHAYRQPNVDNPWLACSSWQLKLTMTVSNFYILNRIVQILQT